MCQNRKKAERILRAFFLGDVACLGYTFGAVSKTDNGYKVALESCHTLHESGNAGFIEWDSACELIAHDLSPLDPKSLYTLATAEGVVLATGYGKTSAAEAADFIKSNALKGVFKIMYADGRVGFTIEV